MSLSTLERALAVVLVGGALTLAGCGKKDEQRTEAEPAASAAIEPAAEPEAAAGPVFDFWKLALPQVAATYQGQCLALPGEKPAPGPLAIGADGKVTAGALSGSVAASTFLLGRVQDGSRMAGYSAALKGENIEVVIQPLADQPERLTAGVVQGEAALNCTVPANALPLHGKRLYAVFASVLDTPARSIDCKTLQGAAKLDYQLANGLFKLGEHTVDLAKVQAETASLLGGSDGFGYMARPGHDQELHVMLDKYGKLSGVTLRMEKAMIYCEKLNEV